MPDWSMKDLEEWDKKICVLGEGLGLDWFPIEYEICDYKEMMGHMAYTGLPTHYRHWSFGKSFDRIQTEYNLGMSGLPYEMIIKAGASQKTITDILVGENWIGSGQSNMEWSMNKTDSGEAEIKKANFQNIRLFYVPRVTSDKPQKNVDAKWVICAPKNIENFSAVLYHFGKKLHQKKFFNKNACKVDIPIPSCLCTCKNVSSFSPSKSRKHFHIQT